MNDYEKYRQVRREAAATGLLLLVLIVFWLFAGFGLSQVEAEVFHLPLWVWASTVGVWLVAILGVAALIRFVFRDMDLEGGGRDA